MTSRVKKTKLPVKATQDGPAAKHRKTHDDFSSLDLVDTGNDAFPETINNVINITPNNSFEPETNNRFVVVIKFETKFYVLAVLSLICLFLYLFLVSNLLIDMLITTRSPN